MPGIGLLVLFRTAAIVFCLTALLYSQEYPDKYVNSLLKSGIDNIINQKYNSAKADFNKLNSLYPELPLGKTYLAAVEISRSYDFGDNYNDEKIRTLLESAENQSENLLKKDPENVWNNYFMGLIKGYLSYYETLNGSWLNSLKDALSSASWLETCIKKNPDFYEAYSGLGSYKYWKSRKTEFLNWLPFIDDEKQEGIGLLESAIDHSFYNTYLAVNSLIWVYIDSKNYKGAIRIAETALQKYPNSRFFKWGIARAYEDVDPYQSIRYYREILSSYPNLDEMNKYNEIVLKHLLAKQYYKVDDKENALRLCNEILNKRLPDSTAVKLSDRFKKVRELKKMLLSILKK